MIGAHGLTQILEPWSEHLVHRPVQRFLESRIQGKKMGVTAEQLIHLLGLKLRPKTSMG